MRESQECHKWDDVAREYHGNGRLSITQDITCVHHHHEITSGGQTMRSMDLGRSKSDHHGS